jgi:drug/metabolite transporter (DMT)-like permease
MPFAASLSPALRGILAMVASSLILTLQDAITKWQTGGWRPDEILFFRGMFTLLPAIWLVRMEGGLEVLKLRMPFWTVTRSLLHTVTSFLIAVSFIDLPLADALAAVYASPIILTTLSAILLGERVGRARWVAVGLGFVGILFITRPGSQGVALAMLWPIAAACTSSLRDIATRKLAGSVLPTNPFFYGQLVLALVGAVVSLSIGTRWPTAFDWLMFGAGGIMSGVAHYLIIVSLHLAPASLVSPLRYLALVWAAILGFAIWGTVPDKWVVLGSIIVVGSTLYGLRVERK